MRLVASLTATQRPGFAYAADYEYTPVLSLIVDQTVSWTMSLPCYFAND